MLITQVCLQQYLYLQYATELYTIHLNASDLTI